MKPLTLGIDARLANEAQPAGVGNYCTELLRALPGAAPQIRLRLYLHAEPRAGFPLDKDAAEIRVLPKRRFWTQRALAAELRRDPPDVFFSPLMQLPRAACPMVATIHDLAFLDFGEHFTWRTRLLARWQARSTARRAAHLLTDSNATREDVLRHYKIDPARVTTVYPGCAERFFQPPSGEAIAKMRSRYNLPARYVLYVGRLQPRKNIARLIEAFSRVCREHPELPHHLVVAGGKGWLFDGIYAAAHASPVHARMHFPGFVDAADLPALYAGADVLALVSLWEGFGFPVLEAMAIGTPVLASNVSSLPEVAGDAGVLVRPDDTEAIAKGLARLLLGHELRDALKARGPLRARNFSWAAAARQLASIARGLS